MDFTGFPIPWSVYYHLEELSGQVGAVPPACRASVVHMHIYFAALKLEMHFSGTKRKPKPLVHTIRSSHCRCCPLEVFHVWISSWEMKINCHEVCWVQTEHCCPCSVYSGNQFKIYSCILLLKEFFIWENWANTFPSPRFDILFPNGVAISVAVIQISESPRLGVLKPNFWCQILFSATPVWKWRWFWTRDVWNQELKRQRWCWGRFRNINKRKLGAFK